MPPEEGQTAQEEKAGLSKKEEHLPPADRPVYAAYDEEVKSSSTGSMGMILSFIGVLLGVVAIGFALVLFNQSNEDIQATESRVNSVIGAVNNMTKEAGSGLGATVLKTEIVRTVNTLDEMLAEYSGEPEMVEKIESVRKDAVELLDIIGSVNKKQAANPS